ncbi:glyoxylate/hydroxypyruvate reductase A [Acidovorax sp. D2M1]|uniref:Glyoxylate/hydroxypyruvate reductase A n=1 Tax=Acidovorax benzenivorans TaxID=2987520 RepID=A0ABT5RXG6_9BURK|nr:glyoxylate/hydroxypyruvate reductase A [Acidovorax benzenivorans]MDD2178385.1 glyoxylate/hydroxypyruvate reductase A [Acidovorax benzenivorans]
MSRNPDRLTLAFLSSQIPMDYLLPAFRAQFPTAELRLGEQLGALDEIDAVVCWYPPEGLLARLPRLQLVQSVGAGIDHISADPALPPVPVCRIVDTDMAHGMTAFVCWAVIHRQRHMDRYLASAAARRWEEQPIQPPTRHRVGIAGLGTLGLACARALLTMGYAVRGWSRSPKASLPEGLQAFHGDAGRADFLAGCDTLICLLPLTEATRGFLDLALMRQLPSGAHLINVGRGSHLVEADLLQALAEGQLGAATLDAFAHEPLPTGHLFWSDSRILVTPHIATRTNPAVIAQQTAHNLACIRAGHAADVAVDLSRGY